MVLGKSFDTHAPIGPWITTADEIVDPHALGLRCFVNGEKRQNSNTKHLVFNIWDQIEHLSQAMTLEPGDLIFTGTPGGVGAAMEPRQFLKAGDVVRCEIAGLGHRRKFLPGGELSREHQADVIIVGAGPVGATLSLLLAREGASVVLTDKAAEIYPLPRAAHIDHEIVRVFQAVGAADAVMAASKATTYYDFLTASARS